MVIKILFENAGLYQYSYKGGHQLPRGREPDAAATARDDDYLVGEPVHLISPLRVASARAKPKGFKALRLSDTVGPIALPSVCDLEQDLSGLSHPGRRLSDTAATPSRAPRTVP